MMTLGSYCFVRSRFYDFPGELTAEVVDSALGVLGNLVQTFTGVWRVALGQGRTPVCHCPV